MYLHHQESVEKLLEYFRPDPDVTAIILGGSVAKGLERSDSDIDAIVVVTPEKLQQLQAEGRRTECIFGYCTYPEGYFDIKYCDREFLEAAAQRGSEPARNAFLMARCLYTRDPEIPELIARIPVFQKREQPEKLLSFYAGYVLNSGYFWRMSDSDRYLRCRAAADLVFFAYRMLLQEHETLFPCHKSLVATLKRLPDMEPLITQGELLLERMDDESKEEFCRLFTMRTRYQPPQDHSAVLSRYVTDHETWWYQARPLISEW